MVLVTLRLRDAAGALLSDNTYWQGKDEASHQKLHTLATQRLKTRARLRTMGEEKVVSIELVNEGKQAALATKLTLVDHRGARILPALYSDNYVSVLPGEPRVVEIRYPAKFGDRAAVKLRGWNVTPTSVRAVVER
jgi:hypothetical protein